MRMTEENKRAQTRRIAEGAAAAFREGGFDAVNIDAVMARSGLTRGAFYAHFATKQALLETVARDCHPLLDKLRAREGEPMAGARRILRDYLDPAHLDAVRTGCTFAALSGDIARAPADVRSAFEAAWSEVLGELARGTDRAPEDFAAPLALATGAIGAAAALESGAAQATLLNGAWDALDAMLPPAT
ncbi:TetR/AcrR family transcriptional regulator [Jannaschia sp. KMU-145]|uniref:TetR/AcrR family transcriptional regulator n=1 Tax=Jannaschia halovivens TaxID=3388667 RepID=UPI00396B3FB7